MKHTFDSARLPTPAGPYSHRVRKGNTLFLAGMVGALPTARSPDRASPSRPDDASGTCRRASRTSAHPSTTCARVTAFLEDADRDFADYNTAYPEFFGSEPLARATVQAHLLCEHVVEIQATAVVGGE
jgi:enamine deaminase RidA (YjgF/YER057c/UK114 family)